LDGIPGLAINSDAYTPFQIDVIQKWYQSVKEKYDANQSLYLHTILEENEIQTKYYL
jgi:hypothetical protein